MIYLITNNKESFKLDSNITFGDIRECLFYFQEKKFIGVDTETEGFDPYTKEILTLQLGDFHNQFVIDCKTVDIQLFKPLLESKEKTLIFQNAKFDLRFLYHQKIIPKNIFDTYLAETVLYTGYAPGAVRKSLDALAYKYCKINLDKTIRGNIHRDGLTNVVLKYAANDVKYLESIMIKQMEKIQENELQNALSLDNLFVRVLAYTEYCGLYLNPKLWANKLEKDNEHLKSCEKELNDWVIKNQPKYINQQLNLFTSEQTVDINWASEKQVIPLMKDLGVDTAVFDSKLGRSKDSIESKVLLPQIDISPFISLYLDYKKAEKVVSTYGEGWFKQINYLTNRIHTNFNQILNTGRMSSGGKNYVNVQNIPADHTRDCFTNQDEDSILICADFSGQEQIVFANWSMDKDLLHFYDSGLGDMHSYIASKIYPELAHLELSVIKKNHKDKRQLAKTSGFAINYGGNGATIAENANIPEEQGDEIYEAYFEAFPGIKEYFEKCKAFVRRNGYILFNSISKRKSYIDFYDQYKRLKSKLTPAFWSKYREEKGKGSKLFKEELKPMVREFFKMQGNMERRALNYPIQGSSAEITKLAGIKFFSFLEEKDLLFEVLICNFIHDEILVETSKELSQEVSDKLKESMEKAGEVFCKRIKLEATPVISNKWEH